MQLFKLVIKLNNEQYTTFTKPWMIEIIITEIINITEPNLLITLVSVCKAQYAVIIKGNTDHNILLNSHWQNSITTVVDMLT